MHPHHWLFPKDGAEARKAQKEMAQRVVLRDELPSSIGKVAGMDVSNTPFDPEKRMFGGAVVLSYPTLTLQETATQTDLQTFPYIPGLLGFREAPLLIRAFRELSMRVDLIFVDGHGVSHPRGLGIATHLGVLLDLPTVGVAKSILVGHPAEPLGEEVGSTTSLIWKGEEIGMLLRTRKRALPLILSAGHKITLATAVRLVRSCLKGYRLPEPTRLAHQVVNVCRKNFIDNSGDAKAGP